MPENCVVAVDITLTSLHVTNLQLLPVSVRRLEFTSAGNIRRGWYGTCGYDGKIGERKSLESRL